MARAEIEYKSVTMTDGRIVDFAGKRQLMKSSNVTEDGKVQVTLDFVNGETRLFTIPQELLLKFAAHGAEQKLGDEMAGFKDLDDAILAVDDLIDRLYEGNWTQKRESSGIAGTSVLARALMEASGKPIAEIKAFLKDRSVAEKQALRQNPKIAPIVQRLEANKKKKAKAEIDTDGLLGNLSGDTNELEQEAA